MHSGRLERHVTYGCKCAIWGILIGSSAVAYAKSLANPSLLFKPKVSFCGSRSAMSTSIIELLSMPPEKSSGLNVDQNCFPQRQLEILRWEPWSIKQIPVKSGSPMLCGIAFSNGKTISFCTRG
jgi:hypothetical protein